jgi:hypothetical protein
VEGVRRGIGRKWWRREKKPQRGRWYKFMNKGIASATETKWEGNPVKQLGKSRRE